MNVVALEQEGCRFVSSSKVKFSELHFPRRAIGFTVGRELDRKTDYRQKTTDRVQPIYSRFCNGGSLKVSFKEPMAVESQVFLPICSTSRLFR